MSQPKTEKRTCDALIHDDYLIDWNPIPLCCQLGPWHLSAVVSPDPRRRNIPKVAVEWLQLLDPLAAVAPQTPSIGILYRRGWIWRNKQNNNNVVVIRAEFVSSIVSAIYGLIPSLSSYTVVAVASCQPKEAQGYIH